MISTATTLACIVSLLVSLLLPPVLLLLYSRKCKGEKILSAWFLGAAGFFVTQMLIRVPILTALQNQSWFLAFSRNTPFLYAFILAFTAGLFELAGRFAVAMSMKKGGLNFRRSLAAGLGHGGIEAMLLVGMTYINNLIYIVMINSGAFDALLAQSAPLGEAVVQQLAAIRDSLISASPALFLLAGFERILTMICHVGMSLAVCWGVSEGKPLRGCLISLVIHTLIDLTPGISLLIGNGLSQASAYVMIYSILSAAALLSVFMVLKIRRHWQNKEVTQNV